MGDSPGRGDKSEAGEPQARPSKSPRRPKVPVEERISQDLAIQRERNRIAGHIHDGVAQNLALLMLKMEIITRLADTDIPRMKDELQNATRILELSVDQLRQAIFALRSSDPNELWVKKE